MSNIGKSGIPAFHAGSINEMYQAAAQHLAAQLDALFSSEAKMEEVFKILYPGLPFDRTDHWAFVFESLLNEAWYDKGPVVKSNPTPMDRLQIIRALQPLLDYNLFTQVLLNLQGYTGMHYLTGDAQREIDRLKDDWKLKQWKSDPFAPKARMHKAAATDEEKQFNNVLSTQRALKTITQFTPQVSFRVSPKGSTPAFADSRNISMIGVGGDKYLRTIPELKSFYITWDVVPQMATLVRTEVVDGKPVVVFSADGIPYEFHSKSGGEILQEVLFARKLMYDIFAGVDTTKETCIMVPRINSLLIVAAADGTSLRSAFVPLKAKYPMLQLVEGTRV
jgi:hypothetical protein